MTDWIWDASALHHAAVADRLDVLLDLAKSIPDAPSRSLTTTLVVDELVRNRLWQICAPHLLVVELAELEELQALSRWLDAVSSGQRSRGEATVFAWAEVNDGLVIIDDNARRMARRHSVATHGTLWILVEAIKAQTLQPSNADTIVQALRATGARLPSFQPVALKYGPGRTASWRQADVLPYEATPALDSNGRVPIPLTGPIDSGFLDLREHLTLSQCHSNLS